MAADDTALGGAVKQVMDALRAPPPTGATSARVRLRNRATASPRCTAAHQAARAATGRTHVRPAAGRRGAAYLRQAAAVVGDCVVPSVNAKTPLNCSLPAVQPFSPTYGVPRNVPPTVVLNDVSVAKTAGVSGCWRSFGIATTSFSPKAPEAFCSLATSTALIG